MRIRTILLTVLMLSCLVMTSGCHKKAPKTSADLPVASAPETPASTPSPAPEPAGEMTAPEPVFDPLSGDLEAVNAYLQREGLLVDAYFDYDRAELSEEARERLARNARFLQEHPQLTLRLEGHCDERGTAEYNLALGERRAQTAKGYLTALGVSAGRLSTLSHGKERPVCADADESCWSQNRRAHPLVAGRNGG